MFRKLIITEKKWRDFKGGDETSKSAGNWKIGNEVLWREVKWTELKWAKWSEVDWSDYPRWIVCIIIDLQLCSLM
jgi:hypothetical protein